VTDLPPYQKGIRWLFAQAKAKNLPAPTGDQATAFAKRVAIMMFEADLSEREAREEAAKAVFTAMAPNAPAAPSHPCEPPAHKHSA
jgi:hypothetical protein